MHGCYAFIRPQEAYLLDKNIQLIQYPILDFVCGDDFFTRLVFPDQFIEGGGWIWTTAEFIKQEL